jgi:exonuclease III
MEDLSSYCGGLKKAHQILSVCRNRKRQRKNSRQKRWEKLDVVWRGQKSWNVVAILVTRRGFSGELNDTQSHYIEAAAGDALVGSLYLSNGNPVPGPKFEYKFHWYQRLHYYAAKLLTLDIPIALVGDFSVMPTDLDVYATERGVFDCSCVGFS